MYSALLIVFTTVILFISVIYFYLFFKNEEQFLQYWGFAWIAYAGGLFLVLLYLTIWHNSLALEIRKLLELDFHTSRSVLCMADPLGYTTLQSLPTQCRISKGRKGRMIFPGCRCPAHASIALPAPAGV